MANEPITQTTPPPAPTSPQGGQTGQQGNSNTPDYAALFDKLDAILRSALKDNGIAEEEAREIVAAYRQQKAGAAQQQSQAFSQLQQENQQLKAQMLRSQLEAEAMAQAGSLNVAPETVPYLIRLADLSGAVDGKGSISKDAVNAALNQVLEDIPALKQQAGQRRGFVPVGGSGTDPQSAAREDRMRAWFNLPPKNK